MDKHNDLNDDLFMTLLGSNPIEILPGVLVQRLMTILDNRFPEDEQSPRQKLAIIIEDSTTIEKIREAWTDILIYRDKLILEQGTNPEDRRLDLLWEIYNVHKAGSSPEMISRDLNFDFGLFVWVINVNKQKDPKSIDWDDIAPNFLSNFGLSRIKDAFYKDESEWENLLENGSYEVGQKRVPWGIRSGPISANMVRGKIITIDRNIANRDLIIKNDQEGNKSGYILQKLYLEGSYFQEYANKMNKTFSKDLKLYDSRLRTRLLLGGV